ncbi:MAG TPA: OmpA family protein [Vulgatibacter sp.]|nr:OmpA family protein [Vulgatibacter sp.]
MKTRTLMPTLPLLAVALALLAPAGAGAATEVDTSTLRLRGARGEGGMLLPSAWILGPGAWDLSLTYGHEGGVVRIKVPTDSVRGGARSREATWIDGRDLALLHFATSPVDRLEVHAGLPMLLGQSVSSEDALEPPQSGSTAFGDLRLGLRWALLGQDGRGWGAALQGGLLVPSGGSEFGVGDGRARADVSGSVGFRHESGWAAHLHVGHLMGRQRTVGDQLLGDTAHAGLLLQYRHALGEQPILWSLEAIGSSVVAAAEPGTDPRRASLELLGGARWFLGAAYVDVGGGFGPVDDGITPRWRALASVGVQGLWEPSRPAAPQREIVYVTPPPPLPAPSAEPTPAAAKTAAPPEAVKETFRTLAVEEQAIFFEVGRADLDEIARSLLRTVALSLLSTDRALLITGYADDQGTPERNEELSLRRAQTVREALVEAGVREDRLRIEGAGDRAPIASSTNFGRSINRRVTFTWIEQE